MGKKDKSGAKRRRRLEEQKEREAGIESMNNYARKVIGKGMDIERVLGKISRGKSTPSEVMAMGETLSKIPDWLNDLSSTKDQRFLLLKDLFSDSKNIVNQIYNTINRPTPNQIKLGNVIQSNINPELDELRVIFNSGKDWISSYEIKIKSELDIPKLKIGFNRIFGYFIEVTKVHTKKIPDSFIRKQTLVNSERYITDELKEYESKILIAEEKIKELKCFILAFAAGAYVWIGCVECMPKLLTVKKKDRLLHFAIVMLGFAIIAIILTFHKHCENMPAADEGGAAADPHAGHGH